ncbi:hypothetical protein RvY_10806 [Ramazzottius varieornatus]|uniref:Uncharacterized protein n=1 Tax=Ramazzottius varieornatus TaxID=947166 RepID=A0A1D1VJE0_RAMVA|nr:hypothetical protein RvY_10806 [Ramazzottius varieornatus]
MGVALAHAFICYICLRNVSKHPTVRMLWSASPIEHKREDRRQRKLRLHCSVAAAVLNRQPTSRSAIIRKLVCSCLNDEKQP